MMTPDGDAKPKIIQGMVDQYRYISATGVNGTSRLQLPGYTSTGSPGWSYTSQLPRFWVLNRANPAQQPLSFVASDHNTVPPGLAQLMDNQHILVAAVLAYTYLVPQGPLYKLLSDNGAGTALAAVENMNTYLSCGIASMFSYVLVSVPGPNEELGIEFLDLPVQLSDFQPAQNSAAGVSYALFDLVLDDQDGTYYPSPSVFPVSPS